MPLVYEPTTLSRKVLADLAQELRGALAETLEIAEHPPARVLDPASLEAAADLLRSAIAVIDRAGNRDAKALAADINLAYATTVAAMDLVKSHTEMARVPTPRRGKVAETPTP